MSELPIIPLHAAWTWRSTVVNKRVKGLAADGLGGVRQTFADGTVEQLGAP